MRYSTFTLATILILCFVFTSCDPPPPPPTNAFMGDCWYYDRQETHVNPHTDDQSVFIPIMSQNRHFCFNTTTQVERIVGSVTDTYTYSFTDSTLYLDGPGQDWDYTIVYQSADSLVLKMQFATDVLIYEFLSR
jgi:hypothetical protein